MTIKEHELTKAVKDLSAFVRWALDNNAERLIVPTVAHDLDGLVNSVPGFSPRSYGYSDKEGPRGPSRLPSKRRSKTKGNRL